VKAEVLGVIAGPLFAIVGVAIVANARRPALDELEEWAFGPALLHPLQQRLIGFLFAAGGVFVFGIALYGLIAHRP
jgi:hypothetical protein